MTAPVRQEAEVGDRAEDAGRPTKGAPRRRPRDTIETEPQRLVRAGIHGPSLLEKCTDSLRALGHRSGLHALRWRGSYPLRLLVAPPDLWPGDVQQGAAIIAGQISKGGITMNSLAVRFSAVDAPPAWFAWVHSFVWLRDVAAAAADINQGAAVVERLTKLWLQDYGAFHPQAWQPEVVGERLLLWIGHAPLLLSSSDHVYRSAVLTHMARTARHLASTVERAPDGFPRLKAVAGLIAAGAVLPNREALVEKAVPTLVSLLGRYVLPDGGLSSRCPEEMLYVLQILITVRGILQARQLVPPAELIQALDRLVPALRGVLLGDGRTTRFQGGGASHIKAMTDALAMVHDHGRQPLRNAVHSGYQRVEGGRSLLVMDAGPPPPGRMSARAHAGSLSFEFSDGSQRIVINCGNDFDPVSPLGAELRESLRSTAAHSTLTIARANSTQIRSDGLLGKGVSEIVVVRQENAEGSWLDAVHDGYSARFGYAHRRRIFLSVDGIDLRGEDILEPVGRKRQEQPVVIRFHLAPGITAVPLQGNNGAALKLANGTAWMFRCKGAHMTIEDSVVFDDGHLKRCRQLVLSASAEPGGSAVNWLFQRGK